MKFRLSTLVMLFSIFTLSALACPELDGTDFASSSTDPQWEVLRGKNIFLMPWQFYGIPKYANVSYFLCFDSLRMNQVRVKKTGRIFYTVMSVDDRCDGGNSFGALFSEDLHWIVGDIKDSTVTCRKEPVYLNPLIW